MEINFVILGLSVLFTVTLFCVVWILEGRAIKRRQSKLSERPNMDVHVSDETSATETSGEKHEHIHVDIPSSAISIEQAVSETISKEDSATPIKVESTEQPKLSCPGCQSFSVVRRGFADKAHRKQRYLCRQCHITFLREAAS
jgi:hypothetical protein